MTEETGQGKTAAPPPAKKKKEPTLKLTQLIAGAAAVVTASVVIGSLFGPKGTVVSIALGSLVTGAATAIYEKVIRQAQNLAKNRHRVVEHGHAVEIISREAKKAARPRYILTGLAAAAACLIVTLGGISAVEAAVGRTLHGILTGTNDRGYTFGHNYTPSPAATKTVIVTATPTLPAAAPDLTPSATASSPSPSPDATPDAVPDAVPATSDSALPAASSSGVSSPPPPAGVATSATP